jgi:glucosamine--fructose-6-phosphate aminotransferase (isomerizing)
VLTVAPFDGLFEKSLSNIQEVRARGAIVTLITDERGGRHPLARSLRKIIVPEAPQLIMPMVCAIPLQLIAYCTAVARGADVDQPRNLAKSVTVE